MTAQPRPEEPRTVEDFDTAARHELAAATRGLLDAILTAEHASDEALRTATAEVAATTAALAATGGTLGRRERAEGTHTAYQTRSPVIGASNPIAAPVRMWADGSRVLGEATFGAPYEGPPGYVHGGIISLAFDEVLGMVNIVGDHPGMTAVLTVKYRRPTPLHEPVRVEGWVDRIEGRKSFARATLTVGGTLTAEAEGLFVRPSPQRAQEYFGVLEDRETPDPLP